VQRRVAVHIDADTKGAHRALTRIRRCFRGRASLPKPLPLLITLGSPLGLRTVVYDRVVPQPPCYPPRVQWWVNIADRNDLIAAELTFGRCSADFLRAPASMVRGRCTTGLNPTEPIFT
jgi:hypothetical protein